MAPFGRYERGGHLTASFALCVRLQAVTIVIPYGRGRPPMPATNAHPPSCDATSWLRETCLAGGASVTILLPSAVANALDIGVDAVARVNHAGGTDIVIDAVVLRDAQGLTDGKRILVGPKILEIP